MKKSIPLIERWKSDTVPVGFGAYAVDARNSMPIEGAIVGDIVGSIYEFNNIKTTDFPFFNDNCYFTDDTVMTIAVLEGLLNGGQPDDYIDAMKKYGGMYPKESYGIRFSQWLKSDNRNPYNSFGNGAAMRVSPTVSKSASLEEAELNAAVSASVTHNHQEGIKGAKATAAAAFLAGQGATKEEIKKYIEETYGYNLNRTLDEIRPHYTFDETCQGTVPEAIIAFLESDDFETAIRNAISLGGDSDTLAAITGTIAGAAYGVPKDIWNRALEFLDERLTKALS